MAFEALIEQLHSAGDDDSSAAAAELARTAEGVDALISVLLDRHSGAGRAAAVGGLRAAAENFPERRRQFVNILAQTFREGSDASRAAALALSEVDPLRAMDEALRAAARLEQAQASHLTGLELPVVSALELLASRQPQWREESVRSLAWLLHNGPAQDEAARALGRMDDERAFAVLLDGVRVHGPYGFAPAMIKALAESPRAAGHEDEVTLALARIIELDAMDKQEAAVGLARFPAGRPLLRALLSLPRVPYWVIAGVGAARDQEAVGRLIDLLGEEHVDGGHDLLRALGEIGGERAAEAVSAQLEHPGRTWAAAAALASMGRLGVVALIRRWEDPDPQIRAPVRASVRKERDKVVPPLLGEIATGSDLDQALACRVLAGLDEAQAAPYLQDLLRHDSPVVRLAACDAFAALTSPPPAAALAAMLTDDVPEIRASAATALARAAASAAGPLAALLADPDPRVREAAAAAVAGVPGRALSLALHGLLADPDERVCATAVRSLAAAGPAAVPEIRDLLGHPAALVRDTAAIALAGLGEEGWAVISAAAASEMPDIRGAAAAAAGVMAGPAGVEMLGALIRDPDAGVRARALDAVPVAGAALAGDILASLRTGGAAEREAATRTLLRIATDDPEGWAGPTLLAAIDDPSPAVVRAVAMAIEAALASVDPAREPLPPWFRVQGDGYTLWKSEQALAIIAALERAATRSAAAAAALTTVRRTLEEKLHSRWNEQQVAYLSAPSAQEDLDLIERLSRLEHLAPAEPRYLDATFFHDGQRHPDTQALREEQTYVLEVAIRVSPTGISVPGKREPILEPRQDKEVLLVVTAECGGGLTVEEPVARLRLPPAGDSTLNAKFRVTAKDPSAGPDRLAYLRLRVFHQYSLLESAVIRAEIVSRLESYVRSSFDLEKPVTLSHDQIERGYAGLEGDIERALNIEVRPDGPSYRLCFTWEDGSGDPISLQAPVHITEAELGSILGDARRDMLRVTMSEPYALQLEPGDLAWRDAMRILAKAGQRLYVALFRRNKDSAIWRIGELLKELPPPDGSVIQVSVVKYAEKFLFPWALLYDAAMPGEGLEPDPDGFWGLRYCIEQRLPGQPEAPAGARVHPDPQRMAFMLWDRFANAAAHRAMIEGLSDGRPGSLEVSKPPIISAEAARPGYEGW